MENSGFVSFTLENLNSRQKLAIEAAHRALKTSYSPYSKFSVGAALLLTNGHIIEGSNQENIAYPSGICAERTALFAYGASGITDKIEILAVIAKHHGAQDLAIGAPCGGCRQVMLEYERIQNAPYEVIFYYDGKYVVSKSATDLLPFHFHM